MSNLSGHWKLTERAVRELRSECATHPVIGELAEAGLPEDVVIRDVFDVLILGHWADFGQQHHFMRRFDGQSPVQAYEEDVEWIRSNCLDAAEQLAKALRGFFKPKDWRTGVAPNSSYRTQCNNPDLIAGSGRDVRGMLVFSRNVQGNWHSFGYAIHALEDSFANGHAEREQGADGKPGAIFGIKRYSGAEKEGHEEADEKWEDPVTGGFSRDGKLAISAVKELILMVCTTAIRSRGKTPSGLVDWGSFRGTWLAASPKLSQERDWAFDFVERFTTQMRLGDNSMTLNCDEAGMAETMVREFGGNMAKVQQVFQHLNKHQTSDVDEIACEYVERVQKRAATLATPLKQNKALVDLLMDVMNMTDSDQAKCIVYLSKLRAK